MMVPHHTQLMDLNLFQFIYLILRVEMIFIREFQLCHVSYP